MFTKNYYYALAMASTWGYPTTTHLPEMKNVNGSLPAAYRSELGKLRECNRIADNSDYSYPTVYKVRTSYTGYGGVVFGTGTTPPTIDDYCLSGDLVTTLTATATVTLDYDEGGVTVTAVYTLTNTGADTVTIGEVGLIGCVATTNSSSTSYQTESVKCLFERSVLDTPVEIPAGGFGQVTYTIRIDYPTA